MRDPLEVVDELEAQVARLEHALQRERELRRQVEKDMKVFRAESEQWKALLRSSEALVRINRRLMEEA